MEEGDRSGCSWPSTDFHAMKAVIELRSVVSCSESRSDLHADVHFRHETGGRWRKTETQHERPTAAAERRKTVERWACIDDHASEPWKGRQQREGETAAALGQPTEVQDNIERERVRKKHGYLVWCLCQRSLRLQRALR